MEENKDRSKMHLVEWVIILCIAIVVDVVNIVLNIALGSGVVINRIISVAFGIILGGYLSLRGVSLVNSKRLIGFLATFVIEEIPIVDSIPTWTIDVIWTWSTTKSKVIAQTTGGLQEATGSSKSLNQGGARMAPPKIPLNNDGVRAPNGGLTQK